jgi:RNA polymerase sigma-70 factor (ECF subfamily)
MSASPQQEPLVQQDAEDPKAPDLAVRRAQAGEVGAFELVYREHIGRVFAICRRLSGDPALAEERAQDAFVQAWRRLDSYTPGTSFSAWLSRVAVNVCLSDRRARQRRAEHEVAGPGTESAPAAHGIPEAGVDLERAIDRLPEAARLVFVLHDVEGFLHGEIAERLGISEGTSKSQLHRARGLLREALCR